MTKADELALIRAAIDRQLQQAVVATTAMGSNLSEVRATGFSRGREAAATIDGRGYLRDLRFDRVIEQLDLEERRAVVLDALGAARSELSGSRPAYAGPRVDLNDTSFIDALDALINPDQEETTR